MQRERLAETAADRTTTFPDPRSHLARCAAKRWPPAVVLRRRNRECARWYAVHNARHVVQTSLVSVAP